MRLIFPYNFSKNCEKLAKEKKNYRHVPISEPGIGKLATDRPRWHSFKTPIFPKIGILTLRFPIAVSLRDR